MQSKEKQELRKQLRNLGLTPGTAKRYASGDWALPNEIKEKLKNEKEN